MGERHHHDLSQLVQAAFQHVFRTRFAEEMESHRKANTAAAGSAKARVQAFPTWLPAGVFERISATRNTAVNVQVVEADAPLVSPETRDTFEQRLLALSKHAECMICSYPMVLPGREPFRLGCVSKHVLCYECVYRECLLSKRRRWCPECRGILRLAPEYDRVLHNVFVDSLPPYNDRAPVDPPQAPRSYGWMSWSFWPLSLKEAQDIHGRICEWRAEACRTHGIDASETGINYETDVVEDAELEGDGSDQYSMLPELESVLSSPPIAQQGTWLGSYEDS